MPARRPANRRRKLSTTVSADTEAYLTAIVKSHRAASLAEAVDLAVAEARRAEGRARLERDTAAYFENLSRQATTKEALLSSALGSLADEIDFDH